MDEGMQESAVQAGRILEVQERRSGFAGIKPLREGLAEKSLFTREDAGRFRLSGKERKLLYGLFEKPLVTSGLPKEGSQGVRVLRKRINAKLEKHTKGAQAVLHIQPGGKKANPHAFNYICLNPRVFGNAPGLEFGRDYALEEVFTSLEMRVLEFVAKNPAATICEIAEGAGVDESGAARVLRGVERRARNLGMPEVFLKRGRPRMHRVTQEFAGFAGIWVSSPVFEKKIFTKDERAVAGILAKGPCFVSDICLKIGCGRKEAKAWVRRINEKCELVYGMGEAVARNPNHTLGLSQKLMRLWGKSGKKDLRAFFTPLMVKVIQAIAANPLADKKGISEKTGSSKENSIALVVKINRICAREKFKEIEAFGEKFKRFRVPQEFAEAFGLKTGKGDPRRLLKTPLQEKIYAFFSKKPGARAIDAAREMKRANAEVLYDLNAINRLLHKAGFEVLAWNAKKSFAQKLVEEEKQERINGMKAGNMSEEEFDYALKLLRSNPEKIREQVVEAIGKSTPTRERYGKVREAYLDLPPAELNQAFIKKLEMLLGKWENSAGTRAALKPNPNRPAPLLFKRQ